MKKRKSFNFYKILMTVIVMSFSFLFIGIIGISIQTKFGEITPIKKVSEKTSDDQNYVIQNWIDYDGNEFDTQTKYISSTSIEGKGTLAEPYQINSLEDMLGLHDSLTNQTGSCSGLLTVVNKYVSLNCDLILNDGWFEEDGTYHDGGDGVLYNWIPFCGPEAQQYENRFNLKYFYGNDHFIKGMYFNDEKVSGVGFFGSRIQACDNLTIENYYLCGNNYVGSLCAYAISNYNNIQIKKGVVKGTSCVTGICYDSSKALNSVNRANIYTTRSASGLSNAQNGTMQNCKNYGTIYATGEASSVCGLCNGAAKIMNCINYGNLYITSGNGYRYFSGVCGQAAFVENCCNYGDIYVNGCVVVGGIVATRSQTLTIRIKNCINYGDIVGVEKGGDSIGGIIGGADLADEIILDGCKNYGDIKENVDDVGGLVGVGRATIYNCENYGNLSGKTSVGGVIGFVTSSTTVANTKIACKMNNGYVISGRTNYNNDKLKLTIKRCEIDCEMYSDECYLTQTATLETKFIESKIKLKHKGEGNVYLTASSTSQNKIIKFEKCDIDINTNNLNNFYFSKNNNLNGLILKDCIYKIKGMTEIYNYKIIMLEDQIKQYNQTSLIFEFNTNQSVKKMFIGDNFKSFYWCWKTGKIGLNCIDGNGLYQGQVTVEYLKDNGFKESFNERVEIGKDYTQLTNIESTGTQYIVLDYKANQKTMISWDMEFIENGNTFNSNANNAFLGKETNFGEETYSINFGANSNQQNTLYFWTDKNYGISGVKVFSHTYTSVLGRTNLIVQNGSYTFHDITNTCAIKTGENLNNMVLMGTYSNNIMKPFNRYNICTYSFKVYEEEILVISLIPAKNKEGIIGLYDIINNKFYKNNGTQNFIAGGIV